MSERQNPPKLFVNKPKKGLHPPGVEKGEPVTRVPVQQPGPSIAEVPVKSPFWYRYRAAVGALLLVNLGIGGYVLSRPKPKHHHHQHAKEEDESEKENTSSERAPVPVMASDVAAPKWTPSPKVTVSEEERRQILEWVLEEKRKVKAQNKADKKKIDKEKRLLKNLLKESHLPTLT